MLIVHKLQYKIVLSYRRVYFSSFSSIIDLAQRLAGAREIENSIDDGNKINLTLLLT